MFVISLNDEPFRITNRLILPPICQSFFFGKKVSSSLLPIKLTPFDQGEFLSFPDLVQLCVGVGVFLFVNEFTSNQSLLTIALVSRFLKLLRHDQPLLIQVRPADSRFLDFRFEVTSKSDWSIFLVTNTLGIPFFLYRMKAIYLCFLFIIH